MAMLRSLKRNAIAAESGLFQNEPAVDFGREENAQNMRRALERVRSELGREYDLVIGGKRREDSGQDSVAEPGAACGSCGHGAEGRRGRGGAGDGGRARGLRELEAHAGGTARGAVALAWRGCFASASSSSRRGWCLRWERTGPRPMRTSPSRSTLPSSMRGRRCGWPRPSRRCSCRASATCCGTSRWAWAL